MKHLLILNETFKRAGLNTHFRQSIALAIYASEGIKAENIAKITGASTANIRTTCYLMVEQKLIRIETTRNGNKSHANKYYPTPYLRDLVEIADNELKLHYAAETTRTA